MNSLYSIKDIFPKNNKDVIVLELFNKLKLFNPNIDIYGTLHREDYIIDDESKGTELKSHEPVELSRSLLIDVLEEVKYCSNVSMYASCKADLKMISLEISNIDPIDNHSYIINYHF